METVISVQKLSKQYGNLAAVNGISFEVHKGEIFGLLGENGAGKTTTLEMIEGLRTPTSGSITILGKDRLHELPEIKQRIGVQLQSSAYFQFLTLIEILNLFGALYHSKIDPYELLDMVHLRDKATSYVGKLSGGQKQRFSIVASLVNNPDIVFLDEPTTGLDPVARRNLWDLIAQIKQKGKTIVLTTHYMEEAEVLCDRIAIMDHGQIVAMNDTLSLIEKAPNPFKTSFYAPHITEKMTDALKKFGELQEVAGKSHHFEMRLQTQKNLDECVKIIQELHPESLTVGRATLEDVFIDLTGKTIKE